MSQVLAVITLLLSLCTCLLGVVSLYRRHQSVKLISEFSETPRVSEGVGRRERRSRVRRWLAGAGFRQSSATLVFLGAMVVSTWTALCILSAINYFGVADAVIQFLAVGPGKTGGGLVFIGYVIPWILFCAIGASPIFIVREIRHRRIQAVENDLPLFLDLLATLAEAGMNFDLALAKILSSQSPHRTLAKEFRVFQRETFLGISRLVCFRRLALRLPTPSISLFVSSLLQSEQLGSNVAHTLRRQANELRYRRQEAAMLHAQGLSVKLVFPLIICFLPGIFFATLGPTIYQLLKVVSGVMGNF